MSASSASEPLGTIGKKDWRLAMIVNPKIRAARLNTRKWAFWSLSMAKMSRKP